ncbi:FmdB family transcriptional regulator [Desulfonema ishimotonii]|uniref:FmdB family transcriptional regulator n=1 Tax=Desulfonema ishimotonii TaxID=45657 RepID=A0A401G242_9BACT|nr:zinc ribbon domain-containing protein [Desulfonema ishimotonii]GBC63276.1 FmdB family transcriptional regulator [Desulfonema ishimotonii]
MPIYEFKCLKCNEFFEFLVVHSDDEQEMKCPKCQSEEFERVLSSTNFVMNGGGGQTSGPKREERQCSSGSCTTYEIPGATKA